MTITFDAETTATSAHTGMKTVYHNGLPIGYIRSEHGKDKSFHLMVSIGGYRTLRHPATHDQIANMVYTDKVGDNTVYFWVV